MIRNSCDTENSTESQKTYFGSQIAMRYRLFRPLAYITEKVGHTDLGLGMEVKVTYRYESYELKELHKQRNMPPFIG